MSRLALLAAEAHEELAPLIAPPAVIAGVVAVLLLTFAIVTYSYRDVANRHASTSRGASQSQDSTH